MLRVGSAVELRDTVHKAAEDADVVVMAAAVADFRPSATAGHKIKKDAAIPSIELEPTVDILSQIAASRELTGWPRVVVGFAADVVVPVQPGHSTRGDLLRGDVDQ